MITYPIAFIFTIIKQSDDPPARDFEAITSNNTYMLFDKTSSITGVRYDCKVYKNIRNPGRRLT